MTRYRTIVVDPPWEHPDSGARTQSTAGNWRGKWLGYESKVPYERMTLEQIKALPVGDLAEVDAHLYLWTTNGFLWLARDVVEAWGFRYLDVADVVQGSDGDRSRHKAYTITTEFVVFARRGVLKPQRRWDSTWFALKRPYNHTTGLLRTRPSPRASFDVVEQVSPGPYAELFARRARLGWDYLIGDQALGGRAA